MERLREFDEKIAAAIGKVKSLKDENTALARRINDLEQALAEKAEEITRLKAEKVTIKDQIEDLLSELDTIEAG